VTFNLRSIALSLSKIPVRPLGNNGNDSSHPATSDRRLGGDVTFCGSTTVSVWLRFYSAAGSGFYVLDNWKEVGSPARARTRDPL